MRFLRGFSETFRRQTLVGKIVLGSLTLFTLCCMCNVPIAILSPSTPIPETENSAFTAVYTFIAQTQTAAATTTPPPTETPPPSPVVTVTTFLSILPANNPTETLSTIAFTEIPLAAFEPLATSTFPVASSGGQVVIISVNKDAEYVDIKNNGNTPQDLNGWRLNSETGNQSCTLSGTIQPGAVLRIFAQSSTEPGFNCGFGSNIWNNSKSDPAVLYNAQGIEVSRR